jgi:putative heme-binding domain-containing protein
MPFPGLNAFAQPEIGRDVPIEPKREASGRVRSRCLEAVILFASLLLLAPRLIAAEAPATNEPDRTAIAIEALSRLKGIDLDANPAVKAAVLKLLVAVKGKPQFVDIVREFQLKDQDPGLLDVAIKNPANSTGADAMRLILANHDLDLVKTSLNGVDVSAATATAEVLGNVGENQIVPLLAPVITDAKREVALRKEAVRSLAKIRDGVVALLKLARDDKLPADLKLAASMELNQVRWPPLKAEAAQLLPLPQGRDAQPLPSLAELMKMNGDPVRGAEVFSRDAVGCVKCHQVNGRGIDFGPNLSEIGAKLGKDALYEAILDPSAGISFGYETWSIDLKNGDEAYGLRVSETADELAIKAVGGVVARYKKSDIAKREQLKTSIMPSGLQQTMSTQDLVDLVEYLWTLKKAAPAKP